MHPSAVDGVWEREPGFVTSLLVNSEPGLHGSLNTLLGLFSLDFLLEGLFLFVCLSKTRLHEIFQDLKTASGVVPLQLALGPWEEI